MYFLIMVLSFIGQQPMMRVNMGTYPTFEACTVDIPKKELELSRLIQMHNKLSQETMTSLCVEVDDAKD